MKSSSESIGKNRTLINTLIILAIPLALYFLVAKAFPKLIIAESNYGEYYMQRAGWLFTHVFFGICATLLGPLQFISHLRNRYRKLHRNIGKFYLISVLIASLSAMYLAFTSAVSPMYTWGLFVGAILWLLSGAIAYQLIRKRKINKHRDWMIRNYVITFFFILFFSLYDALKAMGVADLELGASILAWVCWMVPLVVTELIIRRE